jgi:hypothetical protein
VFNLKKLLQYVIHQKTNFVLAFIGISKGLTIVLDAHNDLSAQSSVDVDNQGFVATVTSSGSFPLTFQDGFQILPGHTNMVIQLATHKTLLSTTLTFFNMTSQFFITQQLFHFYYLNIFYLGFMMFILFNTMYIVFGNPMYWQTIQSLLQNT